MPQTKRNMKAAMEEEKGGRFDEPPRKRQRLSLSQNDKSRTNPPKLTDFGTKYALTPAQVNQLPRLMNPTFHKVVFESFQKKHGLKTPQVRVSPSNKNSNSSNNSNNSSFDCAIDVFDSDTNLVASVVATGRSKKHATALAYQELNQTYIKFDELKSLMQPFSLPDSTQDHSISSLVSKKGVAFENKTRCLILENLPLNCTETDLVLLLRKYDKLQNTRVAAAAAAAAAAATAKDAQQEEKKENNEKGAEGTKDTKDTKDAKDKKEEEKKGSEGSEGSEGNEVGIWRVYCEMLDHISFERDDDASITQSGFVQFRNASDTKMFVEVLEGVELRGHKLKVDWYGKDMIPKFDNLREKATYVVVTGWPSKVSDIGVWKYLATEFKVEPKNLVLNFRHALCPVAILRFPNNKKARACYDNMIDNNAKYVVTNSTNHNNSKVGSSETSYRLFIRFGRQSEFKSESNVAQYSAQVARTSNKIDISNIGWNVSKDELLEMFENDEKGNYDIVKCHLTSRKDLNSGNALVEFAKSGMAEAAVMRLNGTVIKSHAVKIKLHQTQSLEDKKAYRQLEQFKIMEQGKQNQEKKDEKIAKRKLKNRKRKMRKARVSSRSRR